VWRLPTWWAHAFRLIGGFAATACAIGAVAVAVGPGRSTTYAGHSELTATLAFTAGIALVVTAGLMWLDPRMQRMESLALMAALVWYGPVWTGWAGGPVVVRSLGTVFERFLLPLVVHMVLAQPHGWLRKPADRVVTASAYVGACIGSLGFALFDDPFYDPGCWANCSANVFLLHSAPHAARSTETVARWLTVAIAGAFAVLCTRRLVTASPPALRLILPGYLPALLFAVTVATSSAVPTKAIDEPSQQSIVLFAVESGTMILVAAGLGWNAVRPAMQRRHLAGIVSDLGEAPAPGSLEAALGRAVGDSSLRLAYWLPEPKAYVDAMGRRVSEPRSSPGREITTLLRGGQRFAVVSHAAGLSQVDRAFGTAVRLALDNERLRAQALAQVNELRDSRTRIVQTGDAERRRLERDLHDGAQQRLLAASYELQLARSVAEDVGDADAGAALTAVLNRTQTVLDELRQIADGIFPAVLAGAGLAAALASLGDTAPVRLDFEEVADVRYSPSTETTAYLLVVEAVDDAAARGATTVAVKAGRSMDSLTIEVHDNGSARLSHPLRAADRVGAQGGSIHFGATTLRAELPCE
jgi:signal transduction histidine kinase